MNGRGSRLQAPMIVSYCFDIVIAALLRPEPLITPVIVLAENEPEQFAGVYPVEEMVSEAVLPVTVPEVVTSAAVVLAIIERRTSVRIKDVSGGSCDSDHTSRHTSLRIESQRRLREGGAGSETGELPRRLHGLPTELRSVASQRFSVGTV